MSRRRTGSTAAASALTPVMTRGLALADGEVLAEFDRLDEEQILAEMQGDLLNVYVYSFQQDGQTVEGLSWAGVKEAARNYGGIQVEPVTPLQVMDDPNERGKVWTCIVKAIDVRTASSRMGAASQPTKMKKRDGTLRDNDFAMQVCLSKAQRNAIRALLPEELIVRLIKAAREKGKVQNVDRRGIRNGGGGNGNGEGNSAPANGITEKQVRHITALNDALGDHAWPGPALGGYLTHPKGYEHVLGEQRKLHQRHCGDTCPHFPNQAAGGDQQPQGGGGQQQQTEPEQPSDA